MRDTGQIGYDIPRRTGANVGHWSASLPSRHGYFGDHVLERAEHAEFSTRTAPASTLQLADARVTGDGLVIATCDRQ
jgi:hypothetical protein